MKDLTAKIITIGFLTIFGFHFLFGFLFESLYDHNDDIDFIGLMFRALVFGLFYTTAFTLAFRSSFKAKFKFLETNTPIDNIFGNNQSVVNIDTGFDFDKFNQVICNDFITTYIDRNEKLIKIRDKFKLFSWGAAAVIKIDNDNNCIKINSFPMNGTGNKLDKELTDKIKAKLKESTTAQHALYTAKH